MFYEKIKKIKSLTISMFVTQIQENLLIDTIEHDKNMQNIENRLISVRHSCFVKNKSERIEVFGKSIFF